MIFWQTVTPKTSSDSGWGLMLWYSFSLMVHLTTKMTTGRYPKAVCIWHKMNFSKITGIGYFSSNHHFLPKIVLTGTIVISNPSTSLP